VIVFDLDAQAAFPFREVDEGVPFINDAPENGKEFTFLKGFLGENAVPIAIGFRAGLNLR